MVQLKEMNDTVSLADQMQSDHHGPVILVNVFTVKPEDSDALLETWSKDATFMREQPGYISTQLHQAIAGSGTFLNYAVWESVESFRAAFSNPEFQKHISSYPESTVVSPHLFEKLSVPGFCVG